MSDRCRRDRESATARPSGLLNSTLSMIALPGLTDEQAYVSHEVRHW